MLRTELLTGNATVQTEMDSLRNRLHERLRRPATPSAVPQSLPVLFFGNLFTAKAASVGLSPSRREYQDKHGQELTGTERRFQTVGSLHAESRETLTDRQCELALETMRDYFLPGRPVYSWFRPLSRVAEGMGLWYDQGEIAHMDLSQEATDPNWGELKKQEPYEFAILQDAGIAYLRWQLMAFGTNTIVCDGKTALETVIALLTLA